MIMERMLSRLSCEEVRLTSHHMGVSERRYLKMLLLLMLLSLLTYTKAHQDRANPRHYDYAWPQDPKDDSIFTDVSEEKRVVRMLERRYLVMGKNGRPVKNASHPVHVQFGLGLIKMELKEKEHMLTMSTWAKYRWMDEYLRWDPAQFSGISLVKLEHDNIWIPDVMLYNTASTDDAARDVMAVVRYDGVVTWYPHQVFHSSCAVDVRNFPFDNQTCHMWFGSWTHTMDEVVLDLAFGEGIDLSTFKSVYKDASEWEIVNHTAVQKGMPEEDPAYTILAFTLLLKRKLMFSTYILTMPAIFLSFLTLLVFWLPPEHADKSALGLTIFGSMLLLLLILVEAAPPTASAAPLLGVYYCFTTVIVILSIFLSSLVVKLGQGSDRRRPVPSIVRKVILHGLARILFVKDDHARCKRLVTSVKRQKSIHERQDKSCHLGEKELYESCDSSVMLTDDSMRANGVYGTGSSNPGCSQLERQLRDVQCLLREMVKRQGETEQRQRHREDIRFEWRMLAMVVDRLFFVCYLVAIIISLVLLFPRDTNTT